MKKMVVDTLGPLAVQPYFVKVGPGLRHAAEDEIRQIAGRHPKDTRCIFLTDHNVWNRGRARALHAVLGRAFKQVDLITVMPGEACKTWESARMIVGTMESLRLDRGDVMITCGGGTISDLGGFAASIYKRGIRLIHFPTTLLAMVDAAIGGKTGINGQSKNAFGTFYNPQAVIADTEFLTTLPVAELTAGYAEVIKAAMIWDEGLFLQIEEGERPEDMPPLALNEIIERAALTKVRIVGLDPFEKKDLRALLNFGHTFGHAIEACTDFAVPHGLCVALGMVMATEIAVLNETCDRDVLDRLLSVLSRAGLPQRVRHVGYRHISADLMLEFMLEDKKMEGDILPLVLPTKIGSAVVSRSISKTLIEEYLKVALTHD